MNNATEIIKKYFPSYQEEFTEEYKVKLHNCLFEFADYIAKERLKTAYRPNKEFLLLKDINWFGKIIHSGTIYKQISNDYYYPVINGAKCPSMQVDFYTVLNNPEYFLQVRF